MASTFKWVAPETINSALTTELNSLANGSYSAASSAIDNETDLYQFIDIEVYLASLTPTSGNNGITIYLLPSVDGTNYVDGGGSTAPPAECAIATVSLSTSTGAKRRAAVDLVIPPLKFKIVILNSAGVALAASGNTVKYRRHNGQGT